MIHGKMHGSDAMQRCWRCTLPQGRAGTCLARPTVIYTPLAPNRFKDFWRE